MTLKIRILRCSRRLFIILVSLTVTLFSGKMLIYTRCILGFMSNLIKKSWKDSISYAGDIVSPVLMFNTKRRLQSYQLKKNNPCSLHLLLDDLNLNNKPFFCQLFKKEFWFLTAVLFGFVSINSGIRFGVSCF